LFNAHGIQGYRAVCTAMGMRVAALFTACGRAGY
jgi:hypothetical protein